MDRKKYTEANRIAWNEVMPYHQKAKDGKFFRAFLTPGYSCLDDVVASKLNECGVKGKDVAQLGCNDGRETLSLKNMGANRTVGFDISDSAISEARKLAETAKLTCEFVRTDIYEIPENYDNSFDLIYISIGFLPWLPDLGRFFEIAARLLRKNGQLLIYESHPFLHMFDAEAKDYPPRIVESYFRREPWVDTTSLDYYTNTVYDASAQYNFPHTLSDLIGGMVRAGLEVVRFEEYAEDISLCYAHFNNKEPKIPMSYILIGQKKR
jgi:ubiquinone/menaquinone biosynthesis C-methylase UbiE